MLVMMNTGQFSEIPMKKTLEILMEIVLICETDHKQTHVVNCVYYYYYYYYYYLLVLNFFGVLPVL